LSLQLLFCRCVRLCSCFSVVASAFAVAFLVVIPEGDLLWRLSLQLQLQLPLPFPILLLLPVPAVILSAAKDPDELHPLKPTELSSPFSTRKINLHPAKYFEVLGSRPS
jgi:hypothetical protein